MDNALLIRLSETRIRYVVNQMKNIIELVAYAVEYRHDKTFIATALKVFSAYESVLADLVWSHIRFKLPLTPALQDMARDARRLRQKRNKIVKLYGL